MSKFVAVSSVGPAIYYYVDCVDRYPDGEIRKGKRMSVCLLYLTVEGKWARGVALASVKDTFRKKIGRAIAHGRALKAIVVRAKWRACFTAMLTIPRFHQVIRLCPISRVEAHRPLYLTRARSPRSLFDDSLHKSVYPAKLSRYEESLAEKAMFQPSRLKLTAHKVDPEEVDW